MRARALGKFSWRARWADYLRSKFKDKFVESFPIFEKNKMIVHSFARCAGFPK